jgi:hypothetical protein
MARLLHSLSAGTSGRFRALDRRLHIDHSGRSEWIWAVPILTFLGTLAMVIVAGAVLSGASAALYVPVGVIVGLLMAGMSVAYMTPAPDDGNPGGDGGGGGRGPHISQPPQLDPWSRWLGEPSRLPREPSPRRRRDAAARRDADPDREPAGTPR